MIGTVRLIEFIEHSHGWFWLDDIYKTFNLREEGERSNIRVYCRRLVERGLLERDDRVDGRFRKPEKNLEVMDLTGAVPSVGMDIKYPFGLEKYILTLPKSIIAIAGAPNSGKTAMMLGTALMNQHKQRVAYFSSEMGASRLKARLLKFPGIEDMGIIFEAYERGGNFHDVIFPEAINLIDYLEIYDNFYEVGGLIKKIFDKLTTGIAIIAIQKNPSKYNNGRPVSVIDLGRGGNFGLEKASLYVAMDAGHFKIIKAKEWANSTVNPNNMEWEYSLVDGASFIIKKSTITVKPQGEAF